MATNEALFVYGMLVGAGVTLLAIGVIVIMMGRKWGR